MRSQIDRITVTGIVIWPFLWMHSFIWIVLGLGWSSSRCRDDLTPCLGSCDHCWLRRLTWGGGWFGGWGERLALGVWHRKEKWCNQCVCETDCANRAPWSTILPFVVPFLPVSWHKWYPIHCYSAITLTSERKEKKKKKWDEAWHGAKLDGWIWAMH